jgi:hypothetical protein
VLLKMQMPCRQFRLLQILPLIKLGMMVQVRQLLLLLLPILLLPWLWILVKDSL